MEVSFQNRLADIATAFWREQYSGGRRDEIGSGDSPRNLERKVRLQADDECSRNAAAPLMMRRERQDQNPEQIEPAPAPHRTA